MIRALRPLPLVLLLGAPAALPAFGQNKVRSDSFDWRIVRTPHFEIHATPEGAALLPRVAQILEESHARITADAGVPVPGPTPVFLYATHNEFEQTNIADIGEGTGGVTEAFKNRLLIFNDGTDAWLRHVLPHEFTHVVEFEALYGGLWRSARLLKSPFYPLWFMEGLSEYESSEVDRAEEDMVLRDAATRGALYPLSELHGFNHLKPHQVTLGYKQGGAAVRFLAEEYGRDKPGEYLKLMRDRFDENSILQELTGQDFARFDARYREWLTDYYAEQAIGATEPETDGVRATPADGLPVFNSGPALSPDGRRLAYVSDRGGRHEVIVRRLDTGEEITVAGLEGARTENLHSQNRALAFSPDGRWIAFFGEKEQRDYLYLFDVERRRLRRVRAPLAEMRSPTFSPDGARLAVSALVVGRRDLFEISRAGRVLRRLTQTPEDDDQPAYSPDGRRLVFSREVPAGVDAPPDRQLVLWDLEAGAAAAETRLPGRETEPVFGPEGKDVFFVGEGTSAIRNLYRWNPDSGAVSRLTRVVGGNFSPVFSRDGGVSYFASYRDQSMHLYRAAPDLWTRPGEPAASAAGAPPPPPPGPVAEARPYRWKASTDLFFPVVYYSSEGGLFAAALWQSSEWLGDHDLRLVFQYASGDRLLDYTAEYAYRRFRPEFFLAASGQSFYNDVDRTDREREAVRTLGARYPLDRFHRLEGAVSLLHRDRTFSLSPSRDFQEDENTFSAGWTRDTAAGRYLGVTRGSRLSLEEKWTSGALGTDRRYRTHRAEHHVFFPTGGESALAFRTRAGASVGHEPERLRLGGADRLRGYPRRGDDVRSTRFLLANAEWRAPLIYLRGATLPVMAGVTVKAIYGTLFADAGLDWNSRRELRSKGWTDVRQSVGAGVGFPAFVFQSFPLWADVQAAKRTDARFWTFYLSIGPTF